MHKQRSIFILSGMLMLFTLYETYFSLCYLFPKINFQNIFFSILLCLLLTVVCGCMTNLLLSEPKFYKLVFRLSCMMTGVKCNFNMDGFHFRVRESENLFHWAKDQNVDKWTDFKLNPEISSVLSCDNDNNYEIVQPASCDGNYSLNIPVIVNKPLVVS